MFRDIPVKGGGHLLGAKIVYSQYYGTFREIPVKGGGPVLGAKVEESAAIGQHHHHPPRPHPDTRHQRQRRF